MAREAEGSGKIASEDLYCVLIAMDALRVGYLSFSDKSKAGFMPMRTERVKLPR